MPRVLASPRVQCLDEDLITDLAAGRVRLDTPGVEEHLAKCPSCATLLASAVEEFDAGSAWRRDPAAAVVQGPQAPPPGAGPVGKPSGQRDPARGPGLALGTILKGTYIVKRMVGSGGMGEVYEVAHVRLAGRYAIKILRVEISGR